MNSNDPNCEPIPTRAEWDVYLVWLAAALTMVRKAHDFSPTGENAELQAVEETLRIERQRAASERDRCDEGEGDYPLGSS